jgi:AcrR family transcriptional regulator
MTKRKTQPYHHGDLRKTILESALNVLEEAPAEGISLRELARDAGVSPMALYRHFADKDALWNAVARVGFDILGARMVAADKKAKDPRAAFTAMGVAYVAFANERPGLFRLMYAGNPLDAPVTPTESLHAGYAALERRIEQLAKPGEQEAALFASWSLVHGLATLAVGFEGGDDRLRTDRTRAQVANPVAVVERACRFFLGAFG